MPRRSVTFRNASRTLGTPARHSVSARKVVGPAMLAGRHRAAVGLADPVEDVRETSLRLVKFDLL